MAGANLLALLDDITTVLDDVAILSKVAAKKTAGVLGDDLALNAQQVAGVQANRELPVIWAVAKGSLRNKAILVPAALLISAFAPWLVIPLLMVGGAYLCFEGAEKLAHRFFHGKPGETSESAKLIQALADPAIDLVECEREKIVGAIRTDFILSAEIIVIALGIVAQHPLPTRIGVLAAIALLMTVAVYGFVAVIIKIDDLGLWLQKKNHPLARITGSVLLQAAPWLMRLLSVAGTAAMFLVGGGILVHGIPPLAHSLETLGALVGGFAATVVLVSGNGLFGIFTGTLLVLLLAPFKQSSSPPERE
ncbi:MAG: DUF808 domain-containing protein [Desulforhopalus sp.]|jgi:predicted DNA repair protein MutK|nr:DUF808 domain-containing protein [Desulforhopalus sp.]